MSQHPVDADLAAVESALPRLDPRETARLDRQRSRQLFDEVLADLESVSTDLALAEVFGLGVLHPNADIRYEMLSFAAENADSVFARRYLKKCTHDDNDFIAFEAIRRCGELDIQDSIDDLVSIVGWPSEGVLEKSKPVGMGRATGLTALTEIFGTTDPEKLADLEEHYRQHGHLPTDKLSKPSLSHPNEDPTDHPEGSPDEAPDGMVYVPGGYRTMGADESKLDRTWFDNSDITEPYEVYVPPFYIDEYPVTNEEYDEFVAWVEENDHRYCSPGEQEDKDHRRNTVDDDTGPDHPVTGMDFYDAYAYANWAGKDLPMEEEWETAARGSSGNVYPWGDAFDPGRCNWAGRVYDTEFDDVWDWIETVRKSDPRIPETPTTPVDAFPEGASEFGCLDMVGNAWEYTKTNFVSRQEMELKFSHRSTTTHEHLIGNNSALVGIRGGAWSSVPEMTSAVFRGKDLFTDRHNEITFRCVRRVR
jgi:formylglycine-generating enzyme required for sulfatase activity